MSATSVSPTRLASAHGAVISDIVLEKRPCTGRGRKLTLAQENVLNRLYELERPSLPDGEVPVKPFWVHLASRFQQCTGRDYSWLSVRRRIMGPAKASQRTKNSKPHSGVGEVGEKTPTVEAVPLNVAEDPLPEQTPGDESPSPQKQHQTTSNFQSPDGPEYSEREGSPSRATDRTRRVLFPGAAKPTQNIGDTAGSNCAPRKRLPVRPWELESPPAHQQKLRMSNLRNSTATNRSHHRPDPVSHRGSLAGPTISPSPSRAHENSAPRQVSRKPEAPTVSHGSRDKVPAEKIEVRCTRRTSRPDYLDDSLYPSDPDELPMTPVLISRSSCRVKNKFR